MAKFVGTTQEFHHFIGPKIRNAINGITRGHRSQRGGICEMCQGKAELQSAHVHGRDRRSIIEKELQEYQDEQGNISCVLEEIELRILKAHLPLDSTFKFVCQACHKAYDSANFEPKLEPEQNMNIASIDSEFPKLYKIANWAINPTQINHRIVRAFLSLERNGEVEHSNLKRYCTEDLGIKTFNENFASMKTDAGNSHGRVFFNDGSRVRILERVRKEIDATFNEKPNPAVHTDAAR
jgi:hypothetical protein